MDARATLVLFVECVESNKVFLSVAGHLLCIRQSNETSEGWKFWRKGLESLEPICFEDVRWVDSNTDVHWNATMRHVHATIVPESTFDLDHD